LLTISGLKKTLGNFTISIDSMSITQCGIYGLIGPNGSGKSTAAKLIMDLIPRDEGAVEFGGFSRRGVTLLSQKPYMLNGTVYENLIFPLKLRKITPDPVLCKEYLQKIGLWERQKQKAASLSSGEKQKLSFMRALIFKPKLIIADEALTALDIDSLDAAEKTILETRRNEGITWLIISHQLSHVKRLCEYVFFLADGRLQTHGSAEEILLRSQNPHVMRYLKQEAF
jgi:tungstate transport system ATP-binding protein